ncbi:MAG: cofactor-independent phosphoglycerate mutase [Thermodesulfobacteriota bacterium]
MKYVVLVGDGMADRPVDELSGRTPLQAADTPNMDHLAQQGALGRVCNIPEGLPCGSDVANMSILGYPPGIYYRGRSSLEAASIGVDLGGDDLAFRCNLVTMKFSPNGAILVDYSAGHISSEEGSQLVKALNQAFGGAELSFYPGVSYRHLMVWKGGRDGIETVAAHDINGKHIADYLPKGVGADRLRELMEKSRDIFSDHPVNRARLEKGLAPANSIWLWGQGRPPQLPSFVEQHGLRGSMITAVDLMKGLAIYAGMEVVKVEGATGYLDTNYAGKVQGALNSLEQNDLAYVHVEAPDELGHAGDCGLKIKAIEDFDRQVVGPIMERLARMGEFRVLLLPDHPTPVSLRTHTPEPVPFIIYPRGDLPAIGSAEVAFSETWAERSDLYISDGSTLLTMLKQR